MSNISKAAVIIFAICTIAGSLSIYLTKNSDKFQDFFQTKSTFSKPENSELKYEELKYELSFVKDDLNTLEVSKYVQSIILNTIDSCSLEYKLPVGLLHSIFRVESEYRFYIDHPIINIKVNNSNITTRAIGLGGIVWEFWADSLIKHNIAEKRSDLYLPEVNIKASSYILRLMINEETNKDKNSYTVLNRVVKRYYGAYSEEYMKKMEKVTSDLWMRRMSLELIKGKR